MPDLSWAETNPDTVRIGVQLKLEQRNVPEPFIKVSGWSLTTLDLSGLDSAFWASIVADTTVQDTIMPDKESPDTTTIDTSTIDTTLDTTTVDSINITPTPIPWHYSYRGFLNPDWELWRKDVVIEHPDEGYARVTRTSFRRQIGVPYVMTLADYRRQLLKQDLLEDFRETTLNSLGEERARNQQGGLNIMLPTRIRSKAFRRIFGGDRVGLNVTGEVNLTGGLRREKRDQLQSNLAETDANYSFRIDQSQRFTIIGQVGDKVDVRVDQDSERLFEFQNAIKLTYTGYEDEIIQKIEAGNVALSLPGTQLATFSGRNEGLFGLKTQLKVGPLDMTAIASLEKGEKNKITATSGSQQETLIINNTSPHLNTYFFVDEVYRQNFRNFDPSLYHVSISDSLRIVGNDFDLYRSVSTAGGSQAQTITGWAVYDPVNTNFDSVSEDQNHQLKTFALMQPNEDYVLDPNLGYIRLTTPLQNGIVLACAYRTSTDTIGHIGSLVPSPTSGEYIHLKLLRPPSSLTSDSTWNLMFRNVYSLGATNINQEGFDFKIKYDRADAADEEDQTVNGEQWSYLRIFGLDRYSEGGAAVPDGIIDINSSTVDLQQGVIIFPDLRPFDPEGYFIDGQLTGESWLAQDRRLPDIYDTTSNRYPPRNFYFEVEYTNVSSVFPLGFNVLENSEEVYLNGAQLSRGVDYTIDYMSGQLVILNEAALSPGADLEILYESGSIFQLDKKTLLGFRAEYALWGDQSFIGSTVLYLDEKPLDKRVRVGSEPMENFLWDVNSKMVFKPEILTTAVDALPLVESDAESQITVEGEVAQVFPNPNSLNSPSTGDNNGVAYVDDFESVKRSTPLGIMRRMWYRASYPEGAVDVDHRVGDSLWWYNPYDQVPINEIWPDREVNANVAQNTHVLTVFFKPESDNGNPERSWNGIMRYLPTGYNDQSDSKYLEVWLKKRRGVRGKIYFDFGQISEDMIPNDTLDTEDLPLSSSPDNDPRRSFGNGILDDGEDVGLDGIDRDDPNDLWYINGPNNPPIPSSDDWDYSPSSDRNNYRKINGTEGNINDENGGYPDTEDLDGDNFLDLSNNFFRFGFELNNPQDSIKYIAGGQFNPYGWRLYRIPLSDVLQEVGLPNWSQIEYARIWMTGFETRAKISIATMELVGNDWEEANPSDSLGERNYLSVAVVNTHENPQYISPPGVLGEVDPITDVRSKEQSLSLTVNGLPPEEPVWAVRELIQSMSLIEYKKLKVFVHGGGHQVNLFPEDQVEFLFRFGHNTTGDYYQYVQTLEPGWSADNEIVIDFDVLTSLKLSRPPDSSRWGEVYNEQGDSILIQGNPSLTSIQYLGFGLRRKHRDPPLRKISTEIWVDELRVSDIYRESGMAGRASMTVNFADLANFSASINAREAEFHNINVRTPGVDPRDQFNQTYSGTLHLNKFLNPRWGVSVPVTANYSRNSSTPKYYPGSDILVDRDNPPDSVKSLNEQWGSSVTFSKNTPSANPFVKYSVDCINAEYSISRSNSSGPTSLYNKSETNSANIGYSLNFDQGEGLGVFSFTQGIPVIKKLAETRLYYKPTHFNTSMSGTETSGKSMSRTGNYNRSYTLIMNRSLGTGIQPFQSLNADIHRTHRSDLSTGGVSALLEGDLGRDNNINQTVNANYNPQYVNFLITEASYRTTYGWTWGTNFAESGQTVTNQNTLNTTLELKTQDLIRPWVGSERQTGQPSRPVSGSEPTPAGERSGRFPSPIEEMTPEERFGQEGKMEGDEPFTEPPPARGEMPAPQSEPEVQQGDEPSQPTGESGEDNGKPDTDKKRVPTILDGAKFLFSRLGNIRFDYTLLNNLTHPTVSGQADWRYQLGFARSPGVDRVTGYTATSTDNRTDDYRVSTSLNLTNNITLRLNHNYKTVNNSGATRNGSVQQTRFFTLNRSQVTAKDFFILNWVFSWSGLERTPIFEHLAQSVSLDNAFDGERSENWNGSSDNVTHVQYSRSFSPLAGINIAWKGGVNSNIRYTLTQSLSDQLVSGAGKTYTTTTGLTATVSYRRQTGFRIPLPFWPFKNRRFSNETTFSMTFNKNSNRTEESVGGSGELQENARQDSWSISPQVSYTFSNTVTGGINLETGVSEDKVTGKSSYIEFGISVNISIRG